MEDSHARAQAPHGGLAGSALDSCHPELLYPGHLTAGEGLEAGTGTGASRYSGSAGSTNAVSAPSQAWTTIRRRPRQGARPGQASKEPCRPRLTAPIPEAASHRSEGGGPYLVTPLSCLVVSPPDPARVRSRGRCVRIAASRAVVLPRPVMRAHLTVHRHDHVVDPVDRHRHGAKSPLHTHVLKLVNTIPGSRPQRTRRRLSVPAPPTGGERSCGLPDGS